MFYTHRAFVTFTLGLKIEIYIQQMSLDSYCTVAKGVHTPLHFKNMGT